MSKAVPFRIAISESKIRKLHAKLSLYEPPDTIETKDPWDRGCPSTVIQDLVDYWKNDFDWRSQETQLNNLPQFTCETEVKGFGIYNVHFIHQRSATWEAIPLLFLHGWLGNFLEVAKMLPQLIEGRAGAPAFHVIAPSLVDFGFSDGSKKEGFGADQHAEAYHGLMQSLGYNQYVVQGGDIGYLLARFLAWKYPESCVAHHTDMPTPRPPPGGFKFEQLSASDADRLSRTQEWQASAMAYAKLHATRPQTIGYSLADSPVGLLAWIYEKLHTWTDSYPWTPDEILTWVSIYYFSKPGPAVAQHIYLENARRQPPAFDQAAKYLDVKLGVSLFPKDVVLLPLNWTKTLGPLVFERHHNTGGHFAAWECPDLLVKDLQDMFGKSGGTYKCIAGSTGYAPDDSLE